MHSANIAALLFVTIAVSALLTGLLRRFALTRGGLDLPNARSSHTAPTPLGGGIAIAFVLCLVLPLLAWQGALEWRLCLGLVGAGLGVCVIGALDDFWRDISAFWRLTVHFMAAAWVLAWVGNPLLDVVPPLETSSWLAAACTALYLVWLLNLYNFMDGIDGLAGMEAVSVCGSMVLVYQLAGVGAYGGILSATVAAAVGGFLVWNFPRARIFLGDAGSGFIGILLGAMSLQASASNPDLFWAWVILLGAFVVDATVTLARRVIRGDTFYEAHRTHAYQLAAQHLGSHTVVTLVYCTVNVVWLMPWAVAVALDVVSGPAAVSFAYAPLVSAVIWYEARSTAGAGALRVTRPRPQHDTMIKE